MTTVSYQSIDTDTAARLAQAALAHGRSLGARISVAVVDRGGHLVAYLREAGAPFQTRAIAMDKAATAAGFGTPTGALGDALSGMGAAVFHGITAQPGIAAFGGGLPVRHNGEIIGGVGVSGGTAGQDDACAQAAVQSL